MTIWGYVGALGYGLLCLLLSMIAYKAGVPKKYTRKIVHILVGFEWVILYHTVGQGLHFIAVCLIFTALLAVSYKKSLMPMISSDGDNAPGTVYYGLSMTAMAIASLFIENFIFAFGIAVFCTSMGDGFAAIVGSSIRKCNPKVYKNKSLIGTLAAFAFSFTSAYVFSLIYDLPLGIPYALAVGAFAAGLELVTEYGLDNITLPLGVSALSYALMYVDGAENYLVPILATPFVIALASGKNILTAGGIAAAVVLDLIVSVSLGNFGFTLLLSFLLLSVVIDKVKKRIKGKDKIAKKGDKRDTLQVFANGFVPAVFAMLYLLTNNYAFVVAFCVALAEAFSDTAASGIGALSKTAYDPFRRKTLDVGLSGGMSFVGTLASLLAPVLFLTIALAFGALDFKWWLISSLIAFVGALLDSLLGSLLQAKYRCNICSKVTEKESHCGEAAELVSGFKFITNDIVNLISSVFASCLSVIIYFVI